METHGTIVGRQISPTTIPKGVVSGLHGAVDVMVISGCNHRKQPICPWIAGFESASTHGLYPFAIDKKSQRLVREEFGYYRMH